MLAVALLGCSLDEIVNPNAPTLGSFEEGATQKDLNLLTTGLEAVIRNDLGFHYQTVSILGREYYDLTQVDPRYTGELLKGPLDNNGFLTTRSYAAWYKVVQSANLLLTATDNSATTLSDEALDGYRGYAQTMKAYALLMVANRQYSNGIRVDVSDPDNMGVFVSYNEALTAIGQLLNDANVQLLNAASEFVDDPATPTVDESIGSFDFPLGMGFDNPGSFSEFNRAIAARTAIYQGDKAGALSLLSDSFMDEGLSFDYGPTHIFGLTGNDIANPLFYIPNQDRYMAHDSFVADAEQPSDNRLNKVALFDPADDPDLGFITVTFDDLSADYQVVQYVSNVDPVPIIRNEELLLIYAEANIGTDNTEALRVLNIIRAAAGLGTSTANIAIDNEVEDELLMQRRYSLFGEGHRWIDLRRFDRMDEIPLDRAGDNALDAFPTPFAENDLLGG